MITTSTQSLSERARYRANGLGAAHADERRFLIALADALDAKDTLLAKAAEALENAACAGVKGASEALAAIRAKGVS
jgi:hypothetical protein